MLLRIVLPVVVIVAAAIGGFVWYRRRIESMRPDAATPPSGTRLTAERLRSLDRPWRTVFEIPTTRLGDVDHVAVGPPGAIALTTVVGDRPPPPDLDGRPEAVAAAAIARGGVDDLVAPLGGRCPHLATVWWGTSRPDEPAGVETTPGAWWVDGHRLVEWLSSLPAVDSDPPRIDRWWRAVTVGIGRPDPLG